MRIITGKLKGRRIHIPKNLDLRPTTDRTKESIFGIIESHKDLREAHILDLFAGSGNLGFEAVSRGASRVLFVETNPAAARHITRNSESLKVDRQISVLALPVEKFLQGRPAKYDFIFADPPYELPFMTDLIAVILNGHWLKPQGWFILEHDKRHDFQDHPHCFLSRPYGRTIVSIFQSEPLNRAPE